MSNEAWKPQFDDSALHRVWTKAVGTDGYIKTEWMELDKLLTGLFGANARLKKERENLQSRLDEKPEYCSPCPGCGCLVFCECKEKRFGNKPRKEPR